MNDKKPVRFNIADAIVLVAATAMGFALARVTVSSNDSRAEAVIHCASSVILVWTLALILLNITRYRATRRGLMSRPGFSAGLAFMIQLAADSFFRVLVLPVHLLGVLTSTSDSQVSFPEILSWHLQLMVVSIPMGASSSGVIVAVWTSLAMVGCWRAEKTWIDRMGRAIAVFWILIPSIYCAGRWAFPGPTLPMPPMP